MQGATVAGCIHLLRRHVTHTLMAAAICIAQTNLHVRQSIALRYANTCANTAVIP
jgi:hypothetical protein